MQKKYMSSHELVIYCCCYKVDYNSRLYLLHNFFPEPESEPDAGELPEPLPLSEPDPLPDPDPESEAESSAFG
jgi:hypothetical protein